MQNITFYARAAETLGAFTDYANAKTKPAPILTRGVAVCLQMRLFKEDGSIDPVPIDTFADVKAWQWVMDDDFDSTSNYILVAQHDQITVEAKTEEIEGESREITEFTIPIPEMNTEELDAVLQKKENVANLNGELVGLNGAGEAVYILQLKGFTVRNRISSAGNPTPITAKYYTAEQTRAIIAGTNAYELARKAEFNIGDRAYYPGEPGYLLVCVDDGTSAADLPALDKTVNLFVDGTVTWQVYDLSASGGGAANITVNDVSPDDEGNILLGAEDIAFSVKDEWENIIPTSGAISTVNLQRFFASMQYAIFSVNGHCAYVNSDNPEQVITDITIYGNTMFLEPSGSESPIQDWDGNPLNTKTVYDLAVDVYTHSIKEISTDGGETYSAAQNGKLNLTINCPASGWVANEIGVESGAYYPLAEILDQLSRKSIRKINSMEVYDQDTGDINLTANDIPMRMVENDMGYLYPDYTIGEKVYELEHFLVPAGTVIAYAGSTVPEGFIACNGAAVSRETYANLFAAIGTLYGEGDGSTTFNLPDLTDRVVQGSATAGTALAAGLPNISGTMTERAFVRESSGGNITLISQAGGAFKTSTTSFEANTVACELRSTKVTDPAVVSFDASKSNVIYGNSNTVQPPALTMIYCIKY